MAGIASVSDDVLCSAQVASIVAKVGALHRRLNITPWALISHLSLGLRRCWFPADENMLRQCILFIVWLLGTNRSAETILPCSDPVSWRPLMSYKATEATGGRQNYGQHWFWMYLCRCSSFTCSFGSPLSSAVTRVEKRSVSNGKWCNSEMVAKWPWSLGCYLLAELKAMSFSVDLETHGYKV